MSEWTTYMRAKIEQFLSSSREEIEQAFEAAGFERYKTVREEVFHRPRTQREATEYRRQSALAEAFACLEEATDYASETMTPVALERGQHPELQADIALSYAPEPTDTANDYSYAMAA